MSILVRKLIQLWNYKNWFTTYMTALRRVWIYMNFTFLFPPMVFSLKPWFSFPLNLKKQLRGLAPPPQTPILWHTCLSSVTPSRHDNEPKEFIRNYFLKILNYFESKYIRFYKIERSESVNQKIWGKIVTLKWPFVAFVLRDSENFYKWTIYF